MSGAIQFHGLRGQLRENEPMSGHVSWRAGGPARRFFAPADLEDLSLFLGQLPEEEPVLFVGLGSNLLVREGGWPGTVVMMYGAARAPRMEDGLLYAEAGVACPKVARFAADQNLGSAEWMTGIPGTVGGALAMNAGCYGGETWDIVERVVTINRRGQLRRRGKEEFEFGYRHLELKSDAAADGDEWFASAHFRLPEGDREESREIMKALLTKRRATQPLQLPNAGSVFRNPSEGKTAAQLIQSCGLKKLERNGVRISEKHANFIVNPGGAGSAADIEWLIGQVQQKVEEFKGVQLATEVKIVGSPA
jgi:UDP-N-acetylmuramate dehydrogenase